MSLSRIWIIAVIACLLLTGCEGSSPTSSVPPSDSNTVTPPSVPDKDDVRQIATDLRLDSELVSCAIRGDILRIDCITPGLDTYDLTVVTYSLTEKAVLGKAALGEDAWETGWTADGFYAISLLSKTAFLYSYTGEMQRQIPLPTSFKNLSLAMLNETADTFLLGDGSAAQLLLYSVKTGVSRTVAPLNGQTLPAGMRNGCFCVTVTETGELLEIAPDAEKAAALYSLPQATLLSPDAAVGHAEYNFAVALPEKDGVSFVDYGTVDEIPITAAENTFVTVITQNDGDKLAIYNLKDKNLRYLTLPSAVQQVEFVDHSTLLAVIKEQDLYYLYLCPIDLLPTENIAVSATDHNVSASEPDVPANTEPEVSIDTRPGTETPARKCLDVPLLSQWPEFPTGCEAVSAIMALRYAGESLTVTRFIQEYLPKSMNFYHQDGKKYGPSPYEYFIGSPTTDAAYGCMAPVIETALNTYFGNDKRVQNTTGTSMEELCRLYIDNDTPVLVWATIAMIDTYPSSSWYLEDGTQFNWPANEHCLVLVGYDADNYYFNDPYKGKVLGYARSLCEKRYAQLGQQSLVITKL